MFRNQIEEAMWEAEWFALGNGRDLHCALVLNNLNEFGHGGYEAMRELMAKGVDHYLFDGYVIHHVVTDEPEDGERSIYNCVIHPTVMGETCNA